MTFKATVLGAAASLLAFGTALAADLPSYKAPPPPPPPAMFDWSGYHIGVSGGYAGGSASYLSNIYGLGFGAGALALNNVGSSYGTSGYIVGMQSGVNWQLSNNIVVGYESEFNYTGVNSNNSGNWGGFALNSDMRWFGAERLRFGYAFGRLLPYVTGGLAYAQLHTNGVSNAAGLLFPTSDSHWQAGWTVGAGVEYALFNNFSVKAEYLYTSLQGVYGSSAGMNAFAPGAPVAYRTYIGNGFDTHIARVGVNYQIKSLGALIGMPQLGL
ncbi:MAG: outer membrane protein [Methylocystis sp.]|uniref:outer membrane protein n=1 Tax=Methylocystis sp. TaxID=1911079 RepID=UPI003DA453EE